MNTAADIIAAARWAVYEKFPYMSAALFALRVHPAPGLGTLAVDAGWRLYYDPETVVLWHEEMIAGKMSQIAGKGRGHDGVAAVIFHELGHVLREHSKRMGEREGKHEANAWNCACDREINDDVIAAGWKLPGVPLLPSDIGMENGLLAEDYYRPHHVHGWISYPLACAAPGTGRPCGGIAGNPTEWEKQNTSVEAGRSGLAPGAEESLGTTSAPTIPAAADDLEQEIVLCQTAQKIVEHIKTRGRGNVPAGLAVWAQTKLEPPKIDWRKRLASQVRGALASVAGACDFTWRRTGRRALHSAGRSGWPLAPSLHQPVPRISVIVDTSGSMLGQGGDGRSILEEAMSEVMGIAKSVGAEAKFRGCDTVATKATRVRSVADLDKIGQGGGGTSMCQGITAALADKPDIILVLTDGYTDIPEQAPPRTKLIWGVFSNPSFTAPGIIVPIGD